MPKINNKGIGFIPILVLSLLVGVSALVGYRFYKSDKVLQSTSGPDYKIVFTYLNKNQNSIQISVSGRGAADFVKSLPDMTRLSMGIDGKDPVIVNYPRFSKISEDEYSTRFNIVGDAKTISFLDLKLSSVNVDEIKPWSYDSKINGLRREVIVGTGASAEIKVSLGYSQVGDTYQTGKISMRFVLQGDNQLSAFRNEFRRVGLQVQEYCMVANCPRPRLVRPTLTEGQSDKREIVFLAEVPVTAMVKSISFGSGNNQVPGVGAGVTATPGRVPAPVSLKFKFENNLQGWNLSTNFNDQNFQILRNNEKLNVGVYLQSVNTNTGQQNLQILINGIGDDTANLIKSIRTSGITRNAQVGDNPTLKPTVVRPAVRYNAGQGVVAIASLRDTKSIFFNVADTVKEIDFNPLPSGWKVTKEGNGIERITMDIPSVVKITSVRISGSTDSNFNFVLQSSGADKEKILSTLKNEGVTVARCTGNANCIISVQKPNYVCGDDRTVGCRFSVRVPTDASVVYFNYRDGVVASDIQLLPRGWSKLENGSGIKK